jgi:hypothetical protein
MLEYTRQDRLAHNNRRPSILCLVASTFKKR